MTPAPFTLPEIRRGDSIPSYTIAELTYADGSPVLLASAALEIRTAEDLLVLRYSSDAGSIALTPAGAPNAAVLAAIPGYSTYFYPLGTHAYDLKVDLQSGETWTVLAGHVRIVASVTH